MRTKREITRRRSWGRWEQPLRRKYIRRRWEVDSRTRKALKDRCWKVLSVGTRPFIQASTLGRSFLEWNQSGTATLRTWKKFNERWDRCRKKSENEGFCIDSASHEDDRRRRGQWRPNPERHTTRGKFSATIGTAGPCSLLGCTVPRSQVSHIQDEHPLKPWVRSWASSANYFHVQTVNVHGRHQLRPI